MQPVNVGIVGCGQISGAYLKELTGILEEAERKVEILTRDVSGDLHATPFEEEQEN